MKTPWYVRWWDSKLARMKADRDLIARRYLPASMMASFLKEFFKDHLDRISGFARHRVDLKDVAWYAKYSPGAYLPALGHEVDVKTYRHFLLTLKIHSKALSSQGVFETSSRREYRLRHGQDQALDALGAIGEWRLKNKRHYANKAQKKALRTCIVIYGMIKRSMGTKFESQFKNIRKAFDWNMKHRWSNAGQKK